MPTRYLLEKKRREYRWFVEPMDSHTNQVIAQIVCEENLHMDKLCGDGERRNLWEMPHKIVQMLEGERSLRFGVFVQRGGGAIRKWRFHPRVRRQRKRSGASASQRA